VGGGSTSLTLLRLASRTDPRYALGAIRLRQRLNLHRLTHDVRWRS
jgi:hypothetical protein